MTYSIASSIAIRKNPANGWQHIDPTNFTLDYLFSTYGGLIVKLTNPFESVPTLFDVMANRGMFPNQTITFGQWLTANGNSVIPTIGTDFSIQRKRSRSGDLFNNGFKARSVHPTSHPDMPYPEGDKTDLLVTAIGGDYDAIVRRSMISVNGFWHRTESSQYGIYVRSSVKSTAIANSGLMTVLSFGELGDIQQIPITADMVYKDNPDQQLYKQAFINLGVSTVGKTVLMVIGGYLHVVDSAYREIGDGIIEVDFTRMPFVERLFESKDYIDISSLSSAFYRGDMNNLSLDVVRSDSFITQYLTLPQSFAVVVDVDYLVAKRKGFASTTFPGQYTWPEKPDGILVTNTGKEMPYLTKPDGDWFTINTAPLWSNPKTFQTTDWVNENIVSNVIDINYTNTPVKPTLLSIQREDLIITP